MPFTPNFNRNPIEVVAEAERAGAKTTEDIVTHVVDQVASKKVNLAIDDPDAEENWPRMWFIWRGNAIQSSAKGHEFFLRHYLGAHDNVDRRRPCERQNKDGEVLTRLHAESTIWWSIINFRMNTTWLYSDSILPTAFWYEKNDLNTTDLHSFLHVLGTAVPPVWESKTGWEIFKLISKKVSELAPLAFSKPVQDVVLQPLMHDTPDELAQPEILDWAEGECKPVPGKSFPHVRVVERDYANLYNKFISFGPKAREDGVSAVGVNIPIKKQYDQMLDNPVMPMPDPRHMRCVEWGGKRYPSLEVVLDAHATPC